jgi:hypothetical protein
VDCETLIVNRKTPMEHDVSEWDVDAGFGSISEWGIGSCCLIGYCLIVCGFLIVWG